MSRWIVAVALLGVAAPSPDATYRAEIETWRQQREARLKAEDGWLSVAGLFWLDEGPNRFGSGPGNAIALPAAAAPAVAGTFELRQGKVTVRVEPGVAVTSAGKPVGTMELRSDDPGPPDVLKLGRLSLQVIARGGRIGIRMKDPESHARRSFAGLRWFPVREDLRLRARFVPWPAARSIPIANVLGQVNPLPSPGYAEFTLAGRTLRLEPVVEESGASELFFIFRDETAGKETYPAGRFLYSAMPRDGEVVLDFNKAYSPPCAFTDYATCPLPPPQNRLPVRVEAGEKDPHRHPGPSPAP
ncbi:MAG: DUF1684 domain-containing protein [Acidobacteria bacterium]|nr:MAG: DUF1684 domain-containing protein [Acidobacteriota bacterium]PYQ21801.1 MAG: DUF1684 domain-containing protein [Acidobacteriota bacterium]